MVSHTEPCPCDMILTLYMLSDTDPLPNTIRYVPFTCYQTLILYMLSDTDPLGHSKRRDKPGCKNQTIDKLRDPSHFLGPTFVNPKRPFPATKRAFEVNKGRTNVSTSRYERIVKFDKVFVASVEVFVTSHKDLCTCALWSSATINILRSYERPIPIVWKIQTGFSRTVWSDLTCYQILTLDPVLSDTHPLPSTVRH